MTSTEKSDHPLRGVIFNAALPLPPAELIHEKRFLVTYNDNFAIYIFRHDHPPPHVHIASRHNAEELSANQAAASKGKPQIPIRKARFLIIEDLIHGTRLEPYPYTDLETRLNGDAAWHFPERTADGKNARRKYSMSPIERELARKFGNLHAAECLRSWDDHVIRHPDRDASEHLPITSHTVMSFLEPHDTRHEPKVRMRHLVGAPNQSFGK